jgi:hypothetical protein
VNRTLTREQKMLGAAAANVLFIIMLFLPWLGSGISGIDISASGDDVIPSFWVLLIFAILAAGMLAADALNFELPALVRPAAWAAYLSSVPMIVTIMIFLDVEGASRKVGLWLALVFSIVATVLAVMHWREER